MKLTKLTLLAAIAATLGSPAAFADDQQLRNRNDILRAQAERDRQRTTTIAVHGTRGVGQAERQVDERRCDTRFELRFNAHGQRYGVFVPVK